MEYITLPLENTLFTRGDYTCRSLPQTLAIYQMLSAGEVWNPNDLYKIDMPAPLIEKQKEKAIKQALKLLQKEGLLLPDEPLAS